MKVTEFARTVFQLIAFGFFVFQMQNSVGTYFEKPIVQLKSTGNLWQWKVMLGSKLFSEGDLGWHMITQSFTMAAYFLYFSE